MDEELSDIVKRTAELPEEILAKSKELLSKKTELNQLELKLKTEEANVAIEVANAEHESGRKKYPNAEARNAEVFKRTLDTHTKVIELSDVVKAIVIDLDYLENVLKVNLATIRLFSQDRNADTNR